MRAHSTSARPSSAPRARPPSRRRAPATHGRVDGVDVQVARPHLVELRPREEQADGAEEARDRRHEHGPHAEILGEPGGVDRARRRRRRSARSRAGRGPSRTRPPAAPASSARSRSGGSRSPPRAASARAARRRGARACSASSARDRDLAVGDGDRRACSRARRSRRSPSARRRRGRSRPGPGVGARAARPDLEAARGIEPGDAAAARADLGDVDRRDPQQLARAADQPAAGRHRRRRPRTRGRARWRRPRSATPSRSCRPCRRRAGCRSPSCSPIPRAATTPAAGPDSSAKTGRSFASSAVITPPDDCMICSGAVDPDPVEAGPDPVDVRRTSAAARRR